MKYEILETDDGVESARFGNETAVIKHRDVFRKSPDGKGCPVRLRYGPFSPSLRDILRWLHLTG